MTKTIYITSILDGPLPCQDADITWIIPDSDCLSSPCNGCTDDHIDITVLDDCSDSIQAIISCPSCGSCEDQIFNIRVCEGNADCSNCEKCEDNICVEKCDNFCDDGTCVECIQSGNCDGDKECIQGSCACPPGTTDIGNNVCRECLVDNDCDECSECDGTYCKPKQCYGSPCLNDECVECISSGDCGTNECCQPDNTCECCDGYTREFSSGICMPNPICEEPSDCPDCKECVGGDCVDKVCPTGFTCYQDDCVEICNGLKGSCDQGECVNIGGKYACLPCDPCEEVGTPNKGVNPNPENLNNPGTDCSLNGGCPSGFECIDGGCVECNNCADGSGGSYENCVENFVINKDSCKVEGVLETTQKCNCDVLTWSTEIYQRVNGQTSFRIRLRKGNAFEEGLNNTVLLSNTNIDGDLPTSGIINYKAVESGFYLNDENVSWSNVKTGSSDFAGVDTVITKLSLKGPNDTCLDPNTGKQVVVDKLKVEFTIPALELYFNNGCTYSIQEKKIYYIVNEQGGNGFYSKFEFFDSTQPLVQYDVLQSNNKRNPVFNWYRLASPITTGGQLIRSAYADKVSNYKFRDAWLGINEGIEINNYYRLESDCACSGHTFYECEDNPAKLFYCSPNIGSLNYSLLNCNKEITFSSNDFQVCAANEFQDYDLYLNGFLKDTYTPSGTTLSIEGSYVSDTPIETIEVRLSGVECQDCNWIEQVTTSSLTIDSLSYNCDSDELSISISGGSGDYSIKIDNVSWTPPATIDLTTGTHTIDVVDNITDCSLNQNFEVDCCAIFELTANDPSICGSFVGSYAFSVSGGSADYTWTIYDYEGGSIIDNGISTPESIIADLSTYGELSFFVEVEDNKNCIVEKTVFVNYEAPVDVVINNNQYCSDAVTHEIEVERNSGLLPFSYDLKQGGVSQQTGSLVSNTSTIDITLTGNDSFTLELTDANGCTLSKPITLVSISCPDVFITADNNTVCEGLSLVLTATITGGTSPYEWTIDYLGSEIASGNTANVSFDTGTTYSSTDGTYGFDFSVVDSKSKTGSDSNVITVEDEFSSGCVQCDPEPVVTLSSDMGWTADQNDAVEISHDYPSAYAQTWYVDNNIVGYGSSIFADTSTPEQQDIYVEVEYTQGCFVNSNTQTLTIIDPNCTCEYTFNLVSGWKDDNGNTISANTTSSTNGCVGDTVQANVNVANCSSTQTYEWRMFRNGTLVDTKTAASYTYTIPSTATYKLRLRGEDGPTCPVSEVWFEKDFVECRTCQISSDSIGNETICDGQSIAKTLQVYDKWEYTDLRFRTRVDGSNYGSSPMKCDNQTTCSHTQTFSGLSVGVHNVEMEAYEWDIGLGGGGCITTQSFTIEVLDISDSQCQDCSDNTASITISNCSGSGCYIYAIEDQTVNLSASATGSVGNFTYQWKALGGSNVGSGSSVTVGPFSYGQSPSYVIHATDAEGCPFTKTANIVVERDCSGGISQSFTATSGCQGDPITMTWDITSKPYYQQYTVRVWRGSSQFGSYSNVFTGDWNDSYNFNVASGDRWYYIDVYRTEANPDGCPTQRPPQKITKNACVDCTGVVDSISSSEGTSLCSIEPTNLTANVSGDTSGWTYTWREGTSSSGNVLGTGQSLNNFEASTFPRTISVWYVKSGCSTGHKSITFTEASGCCPSTIPTISTSCGSTMEITVSNITAQDKVRYDGGPWQTGATTHTFVAFGAGTDGYKDVTLEVSREFCDDPYIFYLNLTK